MLSTRLLTKRYGSLTAVEDLDLEVSAGELFGFLGPNGAGKTTTIKMLVGLLRPTSGSARVAGIDITAEPERAKAKIGYVPDAATLYDNKLRAFDKATGKLVWETLLPFTGDATPATYQIDGRQYIVVATSNGRPSPTQWNAGPLKAGGSYVAFALPVGSK